MNLKTDPDRVVRALTEVEGGQWLERQKRGDFKGYSVFDAIEKLKAGQDVKSDFGVAVIYGRDGWNRYRVAADGSVRFIEAQAGSREDVEKAKKAGFEVW